MSGYRMRCKVYRKEDEEEEEPYSIHMLPDEILELVFRCLTTPDLVAVCARVCRRWKRIVEYRALALRDNGDERRLNRNTRAVLLTTFPVDLFSVMDDIVMKATLLSELTAHAPAPFHATHVAALQKLPNLVHLDVFTLPRVLDARLASVAKRLRHFVVNETLATTLLQALASGSCLVALHMYGRSARVPPPELIALLRARAPHLQELTLRCNELTDEAYRVIGACTNLRVLQLYSCWLLTVAAVINLVRPKGLRVLHVTGARRLHDAALDTLLAFLPRDLTELNLSGGSFGDGHVPLLVRRVPRLRVFEMWGSKLTAPGAQALVEALAELETLDLDVVLCNRRLLRLSRHPRLRLVRCVPKNAALDEDPDKYMEEHPVCYFGGVRVIASHAPFESKYFRTSGEGFRSTLFYSWTRDVPLEPLPPFVAPFLEPSPDLFYD